MKKVLLSGLIATMLSASSVQGENSHATNELVIVEHGHSSSVILLSPECGQEEKLAAHDLQKYIQLMSGASLEIADTTETIDKALKGNAPLFILGKEALKADKSLAVTLQEVVKRKVILRSDAIVLKRDGNRIYLAGSNDSSHYYAVSELLRLWGCRWYLPTEFGECIPEHKKLTLDKLDLSYSPPFEIRTYWISWNGDNTGQADFQRRNFMTVGRGGMPSTGHAIGNYVKDLVKDPFELPLTDPKTAAHIAGKVEEKFAKGEDFSLGMDDGLYQSSYPKDQEINKLQWDKYMLRWSVSDSFLELYNNIAQILQKKYPKSQSKIGFLAYSNMTIPPVRDMKAEASLFCELAPIDIDPIHGMDSLDSPPKQEYKAFLYKWAKIMNGRLAIYDYDQGMLVWRDIPNPSHMAFAQDVKHYRDAGIIGINTESRNAIATTFLNLYMRGLLMWNPDVDVSATLATFYKDFYGPAEKPMSEYWNTIFKAWEDTIVTEHEYFVAPAIYTPDVLKIMQTCIKNAEALVAPLNAKKTLTRNEKLYLDRVSFTRMSCDLTCLYLEMVNAAASDIDYKKAVELGEKALEKRLEITRMNPTFTTRVIFQGQRWESTNNPAWFRGEVNQYKELLSFTDGENGTLVTKLPISWAFKRDLKNSGLKENYASAPVDLTFWNTNQENFNLNSLKDYPTDQWEMISTTLYMQALGVRHPDYQSYTGHAWYRTDTDIPSKDASKKLHIRFPGLFSECWLYVNGEEVAHREQGKIWWLNNYRFEWDVDLTGKLKPGKNIIALRVNCEHHFGGIFRRPFIYAAKQDM